MQAFGMFCLIKKCLRLTIPERIAHAQKVFCRSYGTRTIYALSSGSTKCAVAVLRVSGPKSAVALQQICGGVPKMRKASLRRLYDPISKELLDKSLVLWFPGPQSFTGEDCAEFHVHGGPAVIKSVLTALSSIPDMHPAQPGEFTKQAFLNGKLDLTEVEGLGDLIHAETEVQRKQALRQMDGDLKVLYSNWRTRLLKCLANTEAFIDFHEEENIEDDILENVFADTSSLNDEIKKHLNDNRQGERLRDGLNVVIAGEPNVGKSSLLNSICQRPAAIVSPIAGTTRDIVETALNIAGYPVLFSDTAGLRETNDPIEKEGVIRAVKRVMSSDITIFVVDVQKQSQMLQEAVSLKDFLAYYKNILGLTSETENNPSGCVNKENQMALVIDNSSEMLVVLNKIDLIEFSSVSKFLNGNEDHVCAVSCVTGQGFDDFMENLVKKVKLLCGDPLQGSPSLTQARHRHHLGKCCLQLDQFAHMLSHDVVMAAERLRLAAGELGQVTGAVSAEDVLDVIFRDFCIGK
ncbi:tRNA modification GTPase mnme [Plakobranchus ocellatus]|uniref:tRNA modification GTPase mnme n=1 Tax=Plakobranchus ocellatus TaxID=259542 RepID=A0AAV4CYU7_9GAST|nr:tRNA modification GTPase mnme [Plakobranchus ocellatus]